MINILSKIPIISDIPLITIKIISMSLNVLFLMLCGIVVYYYIKIAQYTQQNYTNNKSEQITTYHTVYKKYMKRQKILKIITVITGVITILTVLIYTNIVNTAKTYGAYNNFTTKETIKDVNTHTRYGYKDQSKQLPNDLTNTIIVYYKYGCSDCESIHDELLEYIKENKINNLYFVSTKSKKGKELLDKYTVNSVPTAIYIDESRYIVKTLYENDNTFLSENLKELLSYQE